MKETGKTDKDRRFYRRWWFLTPLLMVILVLLLRLSLRTRPVHGIVKSQIEHRSSALIEGDLSIDRITGDLWHEIRLEGVRLVSARDTIVAIDSMYVGYDLLSYFGSSIHLYQIAVDHPRLSLKQDSAGIWNLSTLLKTRPSATRGEAMAVRADEVRLSRGRVRASIPALDADSLFTVTDLHLAGGFRVQPDSFEATLNQLDFRVMQQRLSSPVSVETQAGVSDQRWTLGKALIATGNTVVRSQGYFDLADSTARAELFATPLAAADIKTALKSYPVENDLDVTLDVSGSLDEVTLNAQLQGEGLEQGRVEATFSVSSHPVIKRLDLQTGRLDLASLMGDDDYPVMSSLMVRGHGEIPLRNYRAADFSGSYDVAGAGVRGYRVNRASGSYALSGKRLQLETRVVRRRESLQARLNLKDFWGGNPNFNLRVSGDRLNPSYWLRDDDWKGQLTFNAELTGSGLDPEDRDWHYRVTFTDSDIAGQPFSEARFQGRITGNRLNIDSNIRIWKNRIDMKAEITDYLGVPRFRYRIETERFNLAEVQGLASFNTALNTTLEGEGKGITPQSLTLSSSFRIDSSLVNGAFVERFNGEVEVRDTVASISNTSITSSIAGGSLSARIHVLDLYDSQNRLDLDLNLKNPQPLAPLTGATQLAATGKVSGELFPVYDDFLKFEGNVDLDDIDYNKVFSTEKATGQVEILVVEEPEYVLNLELIRPNIKSVVLQDVSLTTRGKISPDSTGGNIQLNFESQSGNRIQHFGFYEVREDSTVLETIELRMISSLRTLALDKSFTTVVGNSSIKMDTMRISSDDGAYMELAIPHADTLVQRGYLRGYELDLAVIQNTLLNQSYMEGVLSGDLNFNRRDTLLFLDGEVKIAELAYGGTKLDSLVAGYHLERDRFDGRLTLYDRGRVIGNGDLSIPFKLGDPSKFSPSFFEEPVSGSYRVDALDLGRYRDMLQDAGFLNTEGVIDGTAELTGDAGNPQFQASLKVSNAIVSGVGLDSITAKLDYIHDESKLVLVSTIRSLNQKAADIEASVPLNVDLREHKVSLPNASDSIEVQINTNNLNLAALNDFLNRKEYRDITGRLGGTIYITGTLGSPHTDGQISLKNGSIRVVKAGMTFNEIQSDIVFNRDTVHITRFRARGDRGVFRTSGYLLLDRLEPDMVDLTLNAENFRVANTREYSGVVNLNGKVEGSIFKPEVSGRLQFVTGYVYLRNFGEKSVEAIKLDSVYTSDYKLAMYDSLSIDMDISFNRRFFIRNRQFLDMQIELAGQIDLLKEPGRAPELFGTLSTVSGYARPLGKRFELEEGMMVFEGEMTNPRLNVRTLYEPPQAQSDIKIWYLIEGPVENPEFKYESNPPMELQNILSYTLFGQPFYALESWKQVVADSSSNPAAVGLARDILLDRVEVLATQKLGIDVVKIDNTRGGGKSGTAITTGWYLSPKVFFAIQNEIAGMRPDTIFILEYLIRNNLRLIITQGGENRDGFDLKWNYEY